MKQEIFWLLFTTAALLSIGAAGVGESPGRYTDPEGEEVYMHNCMDCHQDGKGVPGTAPALDGAPWVKGDKGRLIRIVLHGLTGEIEVSGEVYNGVMPAWRNLLSDEEIAAVLTYIRTAWSNDAGPVLPADVDSIRAATADRTRPWTVEEIEALGR